MQSGLDMARSYADQTDSHIRHGRHRLSYAGGLIQSYILADTKQPFREIGLYRLIVA